jgi:replicative DNA helicase
MKIAAHTATHHETYGPTMVFSIEMGYKGLTRRLIASNGEVEISKLRKANLQGDEWDKLVNGAVKVKALSDNLIVDCSSKVSPSYIRMKCNEMIMKRGKIALVVIDYFALMEMEKSNSMAESTTSLSIQIQRLSKELGCHVMVLAQLNKDTIKKGKAPGQGDLDYGQQLARDADNIVVLFADEHMKENNAIHCYSDKGREIDPIDFYFENRLKYNQLREMTIGEYQEPEKETGKPRY